MRRKGLGALERFAFEDVVPAASGRWGGRQVLAVRVRGASMADEGVRDGDYLIVEPRTAGRAGETVLAEVDGAVTVKRLAATGNGRVRFRPARAGMLPLELAPREARVIGAVVGVLRRQGPRMAPRPTAPRRAAAHTEPPAVGLETIGRCLAEVEGRARQRTDTAAERLRELASGLRGLRDCYLETSTPRLRRALLREAGALVDRMRREGLAPGSMPNAG